MMPGRIARGHVETRRCPSRVLPRPCHARPGRGLRLSVEIGSVNIYCGIIVVSLQSCRALSALVGFLGAQNPAAAAGCPPPEVCRGAGDNLSSGLGRHQRTPGLGCTANPGSCSHPAARPWGPALFCLPPTASARLGSACCCLLLLVRACHFVANQIASLPPVQAHNRPQAPIP